MRFVKLLLIVATILFVGGIASPAWAQKTACKDIPIRWFIYPVATLEDGSTVPSAITGDGNWYAASNGTSNTVIHVCGDIPTRDATMALSSKRKISVSFGSPVTGSVLEESLLGAYQNSGFMNVRNILCASCSKAPFEPFTTRMGVQLFGLANRSDYQLRFMPSVTDAPSFHTGAGVIAAENVPYETSAVLVLPQPFDCTTGGSTKPSWIVRGMMASSDTNIAAGENLQVGTLSRSKSNGTRIHAGQYSMPFEMRIEALACFSY
jgi:hypothetical protein